MTTLSLHPPVPFRSPIRLRAAMGLKLGLILMLVSVLFLLGLYLFQAGEFTRSSYLIKAYQAEVERRSSQNLSLEGKSIDMLSLAKVEEKIKDLDFVKVSEVKYIPISADYLVKKSR